jgi:PAS domain S-box-containing protein
MLSEQQYRSIVVNSLVGIYKTNIKGDILYVNDAVASIFGYESPEEMMSAPVTSYYANNDDRELLIETLKRKGKVSSFEIEILTKTGETKIIMLSAILEDNDITGMIMDITRRIKVEKELNEKIKRLERMCEMNINREIKMQELLKEIENLKSK